MFDHTINALPCKNDKFLWDQKGLGAGLPGEDHNIKSLEYYVKKNDDYNKRKLLKIDCEGCEWGAIDNLDENVLLGFDHVIGEWHWINGQEYNGE